MYIDIYMRIIYAGMCKASAIVGIGICKGRLSVSGMLVVILGTGPEKHEARGPCLLANQQDGIIFFGFLYYITNNQSH